MGLAITFIVFTVPMQAHTMWCVPVCGIVSVAALQVWDGPQHFREGLCNTLILGVLGFFAWRSSREQQKHSRERWFAASRLEVSSPAIELPAHEVEYTPAVAMGLGILANAFCDCFLYLGDD